MDIASDNTLRTWKHRGLTCVIRSNGAHVNGYVRLPAEHPAFGVSYSRLYELTDPHGSLTYGSDADGWLGFDTAHGNDAWTLGDLAKAGVTITDKIRSIVRINEKDWVDPNYWTVEMVVAETEQLARDLDAITELPEPNSYEITDDELTALRAVRDRALAQVARVQGLVDRIHGASPSLRLFAAELNAVLADTESNGDSE